MQRLEQMESRLKADVLKEAALHNGQLLVAREVRGDDDGQTASIVNNFVPIQGTQLLASWQCKIVLHY